MDKVISRPRKSPKDSFEEKFTIVKSGCWEWQAKINCVTGYAQFSEYIGNSNNHDWLAHRFSYELYVGKIPKGLTVHHLCRNQICVNPAHLRIVTIKENILAGTSPSAKNARKMRCCRNHNLSGENLYVTPDGRRQCRKCMQFRSNRWYRKKICA